VNAQAGNDEETLFGTPLIAASWKGHKRIVKMLLNAGADPNAKGLDPDERTPLIAAAERKPATIRSTRVLGCLRLLTCTHVRAHTGGYIDIVKLLLDSGADVHAKGDTSETGETALTMAIEKGRQVRTHAQFPRYPKRRKQERLPKTDVKPP
jgi:ankyrin repeat protein